MTAHVFAEEQAPPAPWASFDVRMRPRGQPRRHERTVSWAAGQRHQSTVAGLTDDELAWVLRTVQAEVGRRRAGVV